MTNDGTDLVRRLHEAEIERLRREPLQKAAVEDNPLVVNLPPAEPESPIAVEWEMFRQERHGSFVTAIGEDSRW